MKIRAGKFLLVAAAAAMLGGCGVVGATAGVAGAVVEAGIGATSAVVSTTADVVTYPVR